MGVAARGGDVESQEINDNIFSARARILARFEIRPR